MNKCLGLIYSSVPDSGLVPCSLPVSHPSSWWWWVARVCVPLTHSFRGKGGGRLKGEKTEEEEEEEEEEGGAKEESHCEGKKEEGNDDEG